MAQDGDSIVKLPGGENLEVVAVDPPLGSYADYAECWSDIREDLFAGRLASSLATPYYFGQIGGRVVGSMACFVPSKRPEIGLVEFVQTDEAHRRKGVAETLLTRLIGNFRAAGGAALYLCTTNPAAGSLYEKLGFRYYVGDGMRYLAPDFEDFDTSFFAHEGSAALEDGSWSDLPRAAALFNHPEPDWLVKDYLSQSFRDTRFERHFINWMKPTDAGDGAVVTLESPSGRLVGSAGCVRSPTYYEQHVGTLSFRVCPAYMGQATELVRAAASRAKELAIDYVQLHIAACDVDQRRIAEAAGLEHVATLPQRLRYGGGFADLLLFSTRLGTSVPVRDKDYYYGGRKAWQKKRNS